MPICNQSCKYVNALLLRKLLEAYCYKNKILPDIVCHLTITFTKVCVSFADKQRKCVISRIGKPKISRIDDRPNSNNRTYTMKSSPPFCLFIKKLYLCCKELSHWCKTIMSSEIGTVAISLPNFHAARITV